MEQPRRDLPIVFPCALDLQMEINWSALSQENRQLAKRLSYPIPEGPQNLFDFFRQWIPLVKVLIIDDPTGKKYREAERLLLEAVLLLANTRGYVATVRTIIYYITSDLIWEASGAENIAGRQYIMICTFLNSVAKAISKNMRFILEEDILSSIEMVVETNAWACSRYFSIFGAQQWDKGLERVQLIGAISPVVQDFSEICNAELPLSVPISLCLIDSAYKHRIYISGDVAATSAEVPPFVVRLTAKLSIENTTLVFCFWCLYMRLKYMIKHRLDSIQYLMHTLIVKFSGSESEIVRMLICEVVCSEIYDRPSIQALVKLLTTSEQDLAKCMNINEFLEDFGYIIGITRTLHLHLCEHMGGTSHMIWILSGMHSATASGSGLDSVRRGCCNALIILMLLRSSSSNECTREILVWMVDLSRKDLETAFWIFIFCVAAFDLFVEVEYIELIADSQQCIVLDSLDSLSSSLKALKSCRSDNHEPSLDLDCIRRFEAAEVHLSKLKSNFRGTLGSTNIKQEMYHVGKKRKRHALWSAKSPCFKIVGLNSVEDALLKEIDSFGDNESFSRLHNHANTVIAGRCFAVGSKQLSPGSTYALINMILGDRTSPKGFLHEDRASKLLLECLKEWALKSSSKNNCQHSDDLMKTSYLKLVASLCNTMQQGDVDNRSSQLSVMSTITKTKLDISFSSQYCERYNTDTGNIFPTIMNCISRTVLAIQLASELVSVSIDTGDMSFQKDALLDVIQDHRDILVPSLLSFTMRWSTYGYYKSVCSNDWAGCESYIRYLVGCTMLLNLGELDLSFKISLLSTTFSRNDFSFGFVNSLKALSFFDKIQTKQGELQVLYDILLLITRTFSSMLYGIVQSSTVVEDRELNKFAEISITEIHYSLLHIVSYISVIQCRLSNPVESSMTFLNVEHLASNVSHFIKRVYKSKESVPEVNLLSGELIIGRPIGEGHYELLSLKNQESPEVCGVCCIPSSVIFIALKNVVTETAASQNSWISFLSEKFILLPTPRCILFELVPRNDFLGIERSLGITDTSNRLCPDFLIFIFHVVYLPILCGNSIRLWASELSCIYLKALSNGERYTADVVENLMLITCHQHYQSPELWWPMQSGARVHWLVSVGIRFIEIPDDVWSHQLLERQRTSIDNTADAIIVDGIQQQVVSLFEAANRVNICLVSSFISGLPTSMTGSNLGPYQVQSKDLTTCLYHFLVSVYFCNVIIAAEDNDTSPLLLSRSQNKEKVTGIIALLCKLISMLLEIDKSVWLAHVSYSKSNSVNNWKGLHIGSTEVKLLQTIFLVLRNQVKLKAQCFVSKRREIQVLASTCGWNPLALRLVYDLLEDRQQSSVGNALTPTFDTIPFAAEGGSILQEKRIESPFRQGPRQDLTKHVSEEMIIHPPISLSKETVISKKPILVDEITFASTQKPNPDVSESRDVSHPKVLPDEPIRDNGSGTVDQKPNSFDLDAINRKFRRRN